MIWLSRRVNALGLGMAVLQFLRRIFSLSANIFAATGGCQPPALPAGQKMPAQPRKRLAPAVVDRNVRDGLPLRVDRGGTETERTEETVLLMRAAFRSSARRFAARSNGFAAPDASPFVLRCSVAPREFRDLRHLRALTHLTPCRSDSGRRHTRVAAMPTSEVAPTPAVA